MRSWRMLRNNEKKEIKWLLFENDLKQNVKQIVCSKKKKDEHLNFWKLKWVEYHILMWM